MDDQEKLRKKRLIALVGAVGVLLVAILLLIFYTLGPGKRIEYQILVDPSDSKLTVDGAPTKPGKVKLSVGKHTLKATRELFEDRVVVVNTKNLSPGQDIFVLPKAVSPEAIKWLEEHPDTTGITEKVGAAIVAERNQTVTKKYPIVDSLPYTSINFKIDYAIDNAFNISFTITLYPYAKPDNPDGMRQQLKEFKAQALQYLSSNGINVKSVPITYVPLEAADL